MDPAEHERREMADLRAALDSDRDGRDDGYAAEYESWGAFALGALAGAAAMLSLILRAGGGA
jgi:hypothetical protein